MASYEDTIKFLDIILEKTKEPSKEITDADFKSSDLKSIQKRTTTYTSFLQEYVNDFKLRTRNQRRMKCVFFSIILLLLMIIVIFSFIALLIIAKKNAISGADVATVISAIAGSISSFLILPKVIAENLFPSKEEDKTASIFSDMFKHDINLRGLYHISKENHSSINSPISTSDNEETTE